MVRNVGILEAKPTFGVIVTFIPSARQPHLVQIDSEFPPAAGGGPFDEPGRSACGEVRLRIVQVQFS